MSLDSTKLRVGPPPSLCNLAQLRVHTAARLESPLPQEEISIFNMTFDPSGTVRSLVLTGVKSFKCCNSTVHDVYFLVSDDLQRRWHLDDARQPLTQVNGKGHTGRQC